MSSIRVAHHEDAETIAELNGVVQSMHYEKRPDRFKAHDRDAVRSVVMSWLRADATRVWVAGDDAAGLVGYVVASTHHRPDDPFSHPATVVVLDQLVVAPEARRQGVGEALCQAVLRWAAEQDADRVALTTWNFNQAAQSLFTRLGFTPDFTYMSRAGSGLRGW